MTIIYSVLSQIPELLHLHCPHLNLYYIFYLFFIFFSLIFYLFFIFFFFYSFRAVDFKKAKKEAKDDFDTAASEQIRAYTQVRREAILRATMKGKKASFVSSFA